MRRDYGSGQVPSDVQQAGATGRLHLRRVPGIGGVDEAGRGPLAGPVVAAAVVLAPRQRIAGVTDSKLLTADRREALAVDIERCAIATGIGSASVFEIDELNILQASLLAMQRAVAALACEPELLRIDGNRAPALAGFGGTVETWVGGDGRCLAIGAASILAKVWRDRQMCLLDETYPQFGFARHKGYGTPEHLASLKRHGPCPEHRRSFAPVALALSRKRSLRR